MPWPDAIAGSVSGKLKGFLTCFPRRTPQVCARNYCCFGLKAKRRRIFPCARVLYSATAMGKSRESPTFKEPKGSTFHPRSHAGQRPGSYLAVERLPNRSSKLMGLYSERRTPVRAACCGCIFVLPSQLKLALGRAGARYKMEPEGLESKSPGTRIGSTVRFYRQCKTWKRLTIQIIVRFGIRRIHEMPP